MAFLRRFNNIPVAGRILIALVLPVAGLLAFGGLTLVNQGQRAGDMAAVYRLADVAPVISNLVHELQKERGASAGFIGSGGSDAFRQKLADQREATDKRRKELLKAWEAFPEQDYGERFVEKAETARAALEKLDRKRRQVDNQDLTVGGMASYYTDFIGKLLALVEDMSRLSTDADVTRKITAYTSFMQAKERAGIERAMGAAGFSAGEFKPDIYRRFVSLIAKQEAYLDTFRAHATPEERRFHEKTVQGPAVRETERMEKVALEAPFTGTTEGVEGSAWFDTITKKINRMREVERRVGANLRDLAAGIRDSAQTTFRISLVLVIALVVVTAVLVWIIVSGINKPVGRITRIMGTMAMGDHHVTVPDTDRGDEIGRMANALEVFREGLVEADRLQEEQRQEQERQQARQERMESLIQDFQGKASSVVEHVSNASGEMESTAESMSATAEETSRQANDVASAAEEASTNVSTVASSAEELSSSIQEISRQVSHSTEIANKAACQAEQTNEQVEGLATSAEKIGEVVSLIKDIADQTNLLALNATIEAARAGEAGKGFAVVANEVKDLANQTTKATDDIAGHIQAVQNETRSAVSAIKDIGAVIQEVQETTSSIASAVEEQNSATAEIARSVEQASTGTHEVSNNIHTVSDAADEAGRASGQVLDAAQTVSSHTESLREQVDTFLNKVRAQQSG